MKINVYKNIFLSFSIIITLYTGIVLFVFTSKEITKQKYESTMEAEFFLERETNRIDSQIETAIDSTRVLAENNKIQQLTDLTQNDYSLYSEIFDEMKQTLFSGYQLGYNIGVIPNKNQQIIGTSGYFDLEGYMDYINIPKNNGIVKDFFASKDPNLVRILCVNQELYLLRKIYLPNKEAPLYFVINWNRQALFNDENSYLNGYLYFYDVKVGKTQYGQVDSSAQDFYPLKTMAENKIGIAEKDGHTGIWKSSTIDPNLYLLYVMNTADLATMPMDLIGSIILLLIALLALGSLLIIYFTRRNYQPYRKIISKIQSDGVEAEDVDAALSSIESLKVSNHDFERFQDENQEDIREMFFKNILIGKYTRQEVMRIVPVIGLAPIETGGLIAYLSIAGRSAEEEKLSDRELLKARQRIIEYGTDTKDLTLFVQPITSAKFALIYSSKEQEQVLQKISALRKLLSNELRVESKFVLSVPFESIDQFASTFREVVSLNPETLMQTEEIIVNKSINQGINYVFSVEAEQRLAHLVKSKQTGEAARLLDNILRSNFIERRLSTYSVEELKQTLINTMKRLVSVIGGDYGSFYEAHQDLFARLLGNDTKDLYRVFTSLFQEIFLLTNETVTENVDVMDRLLGYINEHYVEDLPLSELAEHFHLTESYVSKLIKDGTGITFKNYLNQLKVNHAKELLRKGDLKVSQVAEEVGCKNVNTFIRMFKQYEGVTPGKYQTSLNQ